MTDNPLGIYDIESLMDNIPTPKLTNDSAPEASKADTTKDRAKHQKRSQSKATEDTDTIWGEFENYVQEYSSLPMPRNALRVSIHPELIETLKLVKGYDYRDLINAAVKVFIMTHKDQLRRNLLPKPKILI